MCLHLTYSITLSIGIIVLIITVQSYWRPVKQHIVSLPWCTRNCCTDAPHQHYDKTSNHIKTDVLSIIHRIQRNAISFSFPGHSVSSVFPSSTLHYFLLSPFPFLSLYFLPPHSYPPLASFTVHLTFLHAFSSLWCACTKEYNGGSTAALLNVSSAL